MILLACGIAVHLAFLLSLRSGLLHGLFNDSIHRFGPGCDFFSIYAAGVKARLGESVYTIGGHVEQVPYAYAFRYAPLVAYTLGLALSWLPHLTAYGVWLCLCELALLRNIRITWELVHAKAQRRKEEGKTGSGIREVFAHPYSLAAMWLLFSPYYLELYVGQFTFITASLVFCAYLGWERDSSRKLARMGDVETQRDGAERASEIEGVFGDGTSTNATRREQRNPELNSSLSSSAPLRLCVRQLADLSWAAAVLLKMMPLLYLPIALLRGRWKSALATVAVLGVTSWVYFQRFPGDWKVFTDTNADPRPTWHGGNQGLMALLYALSGEQVGLYLQYRSAALAVVGLLFAGVTWACLTQGRRGAEREDEEGLTPSRKVAKKQVPNLLVPGQLPTDRPLWNSLLSPSAPLRLCVRSHDLLYLYALASAAYLLCYKDVWEHHYVLLLPPLVLLALRRVSPWVWLPPFLVSALPTLFALYDVPNIGYNEDPQRYWLPAVSLLHHAWKPVAPLWLSLALGIQAGRFLISDFRFSTFRRSPGPVPTPTLPHPHTRRLLVPLSLGLSILITLCLGVSAVSFAFPAIRAQRAVTREVVWPAGVFARQERPENCGPAALAAVCRHYGLAAEEGQLAQLAGTTRRGTSMLGLKRAAEARGLVAEARQVSPAELRALPRPSILFFHQGHFAVLTGVQGRHYYVADPSLGQRVWTEATLRRRWRGEVLLVGPEEQR